ncbi:zinc-binding dehydrogenase [Micromonospora sp. NPDC002717]|uniref:zinc-binding dehydrogenase n=1 Tax=Micromonospora sp. NPDC002717 TaxID=3154424 RepID=UPI003324CF7C
MSCSTPSAGATPRAHSGPCAGGGILISLLPMAPDFPADLAEELDVRATRILVEPDHAGMKAIADLVARGQLRPLVDTTLPLREAAQAHERGETNSTTGKIVLSVVA